MRAGYLVKPYRQRLGEGAQVDERGVAGAVGVGVSVGQVTNLWVGLSQQLLGRLLGGVHRAASLKCSDNPSIVPDASYPPYVWELLI